MSHEEAKAAATLAVLENWRRVALTAHEAGLTELADMAEAQIAALEAK